MRVGGALVVPVMVLVVGCTPTTPSTTAPSMAAPTFLCTPEAGGAEAPCTQQQYDQMKAKDAQYAEAERVYRAYLQEYERVVRAGGATSLSSEFERLIGDDDLADSLLRQLRTFKSQGLRVEGKGAEIKTVTRQPGRTMNNSLLALEFCVDSSMASVFQGSKKLRVGAIARETAYFSLADRRLVMVAATHEEVKSCVD